MKVFKLIVFIFIVLFIMAHAFSGEQRYNLRVENSPFIGSENAPVTIVEFIDYQ